MTGRRKILFYSVKYYYLRRRRRCYCVHVISTLTLVFDLNNVGNNNPVTVGRILEDNLKRKQAALHQQQVRDTQSHGKHTPDDTTTLSHTTHHYC